MATSRPIASVVICTYNGAHQLPPTLEALDRQTLDRDLFEAIVVDDGSTDDTAGVARSLGCRVVRLERNGGIAAARNAGVAAARAPVVAFMDDDCEPEAGWLATLLEALKDPSVDGVGGLVVPASTDNLVLRYLAENNPLAPLPRELSVSHSPLYRLKLYLAGLAKPRDERVGRDLFSIVTANCALRTEVIEETGGFDPSLPVSEDEELSRRAQLRPGGARFVYRPDAVVRHRYRPELRDTLRRARYYGRGSVLMSERHDDVRPVVFPFPLVVAATAALGLLRRDRRLPAAAALMPPALYYGWALRAARRRDVEHLAYAYVQLAEESAAMVGELSAIAERVRGRREAHRRVTSASTPSP